MNRILILIVLATIAKNASCQTKISIGFHANPVINLVTPSYVGNSFNTESTDDRYGLLDLSETYRGFSVGVDGDFLFKKDFGLKTGISYTKQGFFFSQSKFPGTVDAYGIVRNDVRYGSFELPVMAYKNVNIIEGKTSLKLIAGLSINYIQLLGVNSTYDLLDTGGYVALNIFADMTPTSKVGANGILGVRGYQIFEHYGAIELGVSYHYALQEMPVYKYAFGLSDQFYQSDLHPRISYVSYDVVYFLGSHDKSKE